MDTGADVWGLVNELSSSVWAFSVLGAAVEAGILAALAEPCGVAALSERTGVPATLVVGLLDSLASLGLVRRTGDGYEAAPGLRQWLGSPTAAAFLRLTDGQCHQLLQDARGGTLAPGWHHTDPAVLQAFGVTSGTAIRLLSGRLFPALAGLEARLGVLGAAFLDVGAGVGGVAIELCRIYPHVYAVGLEPQAAPLAEARRNIAAAGLHDRIALRPQRVEELADRAAFDLVWLPQVFLRPEGLPPALRAVKQALRPGGWVFLTTLWAPGPELGVALARLWNVLWGGGPFSPEQVVTLLTEAGFAGARAVLAVPGTTQQVIVGQQPA